MKRTCRVILVALVAFVLVACNGSGASTSPTSGDTKQVLRYAMSGQPLTLDPAMTAGSTTRYTARHVFESLMTIDSKYSPVPMLAKEVDVSEDGKTYTFKLREGVKFHNGDEMKAEDVVASMNRWIELSPTAKQAFGDSKFEEDGDYTVVLQLRNPVSDTLDILASPKQFAGVMPKEVVEAAGPDGVKEYIGTGPFKFAEWKQDQYIKFVKFEEYQSLDGEPDGLSGKREALVEELYFDNVADASTRLAGLQTGQFDIAQSVSKDSYEQVKADPNLKVYENLYGVMSLIYNKADGPFADVRMRKAVNAAVDAEEIMLASATHKDLYEMDHGYMHKSQERWYSKAGKDEYNQNNPTLAKQFMDEAGYTGEEIVIITTRDTESTYNAAIVTKEQLEKVGMKVKLEVYDFPTLLEKEKDPKNWDLLPISVSTVSTPSQVLYLTYNQHGFTNDEKLKNYLDQIKISVSEEQSKEIFNELQEYAWKEYLPVTNLGYTYDFFTSTNKVEGFTTFDGPILWNTKVLK